MRSGPDIGSLSHRHFACIVPPQHNQKCLYMDTNNTEAAHDIPFPQDHFADSERYADFMGRWSRRLAPLFATFASVAEGDAVLDVGSGTGELTFALADANPSARVTGVDPSTAYVRAAQRRIRNEQVRFLVGDAQALDFPDATFDKTLSMLALNFIPDHGQALREMMRVTKLDGIVAAAVWDYGGEMEMLRVFWQTAIALDPAAAARDECHMPLCRRGELGALWHAHGFDDVHEQALAIELPFSSFGDYWRPFLGGQGPAGAYVASLSGERRTELETRLRHRLTGAQHEGPFTLHARAWSVKGVRRLSSLDLRL